VSVRGAEEDEIDQIAKMWHDGWRAAHEQIVPQELPQLRTLDSFRARLQAALPAIRVAGEIGA
jgi:hypothetical protein